MVRSRRLIIFTRYPEPGKAKTRLIPALGAEGAAKLHGRMAAHTLAVARSAAARNSLSVEVHYAGGNGQLMRQWLGPGIRLIPQEGEDLGKRLINAFKDAFHQGARKVVIIGTDCPGLADSHIQEAFDGLERAELVLGPALDGGYYLVGLRTIVPSLFQNMPWGTSRLLDLTLSEARKQGLRILTLVPLDDIDLPEHLSAWEERKEPAGFTGPSPALSIIIPTLNESSTILQVLDSIEPAPDTEVIVADGRSSDQTVALAISWGAKTLTTRACRAKQMNAAAAIAKGGVFLFLHGDTRLPQGFKKHIFSTLRVPGVVAGAFRLRIEATLRGIRTIERLANWRSRRLQLPYGDQAIFLGADLFRQLGGFKPLRIMEDYDLVRRLKRRGRVLIAPVAVITSGRRWKELGLFRTTLMNQAAIIFYHLGFSTSSIAHWYAKGLFNTHKGRRQWKRATILSNSR